MLITTLPGISSVRPGYEGRIYQPSEIADNWDELAPFFVKCERVSGGRLTMEKARERLQEGWGVLMSTVFQGKIELVVVVELTEYPGYKAARIVWIAGRNAKEALHFLDALEVWALTYGAVEIEGYCRPAMARLTRRLGWEYKLMIVSRDLRRRLQ